LSQGNCQHAATTPCAVFNMQHSCILLRNICSCLSAVCLQCVARGLPGAIFYAVCMWDTLQRDSVSRDRTFGAIASDNAVLLLLPWTAADPRTPRLCTAEAPVKVDNSKGLSWDTLDRLTPEIVHGTSLANSVCGEALMRVLRLLEPMSVYQPPHHTRQCFAAIYI
jgi:hypothetical protein